jgi:hypothetical protein
MVGAVTIICILVLLAAFAWGRRYLFWRNGKAERSSTAFWKWK